MPCPEAGGQGIISEVIVYLVKQYIKHLALHSQLPSLFVASYWKKQLLDKVIF